MHATQMNKKKLNFEFKGYKGFKSKIRDIYYF